MTNDIFYVFQHTRGSKLGVEYNNLLKNAFMALFFYDYIENTIIFALK
nr:MAG: hypothetical protein [Bacteriophage sp.]